MFNKTTDTANDMVEQSSQATQEAVKATQHAANGALDALQGAVHDLRRQAAPLFDSVRDGTHQLRVKAAHASEDTVNYIKHEPVKSMLIAAATGAALMALISLFTSHRSHH
jgi:ElaB/YqjD/DUF883 family membrane-anchored ribosome-binding protein